MLGGSGASSSIQHQRPNARHTTNTIDMSFADSEGPPTKKRRFFTEKSDVLDGSLTQDVSLPDEVDAFLPDLPTGPENHARAFDKLEPREENSASNESIRSDGPIGFDQETFESFVGDKVPNEVLKQLRVASGDDMERAVNMYFDGSWKTAAPVPGIASHSRTMTINGFARSNSSNSKDKEKSPAKIEKTTSNFELKNAMPDYRYVGAFGVEGWATRSGTTLVKHGEIVRIERQKILPPKTPVGKGRGKKQPPISSLRTPCPIIDT